jgi:hypothetical protein
MSKPDLPSIEADISVPARKRLDLKAIRSRSPADDANVDENSRVLGGQWGAQTSLEPPAPRTVLASLRIEVPEYLDHELAMRAAQERVTKQFLVLSALQQAGYRVEAQDLVADKRKAKR